MFTKTKATIKNNQMQNKKHKTQKSEHCIIWPKFVKKTLLFNLSIKVVILYDNMNNLDLSLVAPEIRKV